MKIVRGDIWEYHAKGAWVGIPTNGQIKNDDTLVMGAGLALQAAKKYPTLPKTLGLHVNHYGNTVGILSNDRLFSFPTKHVWWEPSDLGLIEQSAQALSDYFLMNLDGWHNLTHEKWDEKIEAPMICLPKVGCGLGELSWKQVEPIIRAYLGDIVTIVDYR